MPPHILSSNIIPPLYPHAIIRLISPFINLFLPVHLHRQKAPVNQTVHGGLSISQLPLGCLVQLGTSRDVVIHHQQMQLLHALLVVDSGNQHAAGIDAHHRTGRQVGDGDAGLAPSSSGS